MYKHLVELSEAARFINLRIGANREIGIILGSGLGEIITEPEDAVKIDYGSIPYFPESTVEGHKRALISGRLHGKNVVLLNGRIHYYEGYDIQQVIFPVRLLKFLGVKTLIVTNAAGAINKDFKPGDLMIIKDHISFFAPSPLRGENIEEFGPRFPDMSEAYDRKLIHMAKETAARLHIEIKEGVYAFAQGPMYETPAEIRALAMMGADAVGMSTVPEVIAARHAGMQVLGISCITNMAAGIAAGKLSHDEVLDIAGKVKTKFGKLLEELVQQMDL